MQFNDVAKRNDAVVVTECDPTPDSSKAYNCSTVYHNKYSVTWEFPENWSGPARFLKDIAYESDNNNFEVVGVHWPMQLPNDANKMYVDVIMLVEQQSTDVCMKLFENASPYLIKICKIINSARVTVLLAK
ncbi:unnamed protein product [Dicrocoelium dendriticum]|nr:unnamed protein product [Dicrocoelium dendriticum]